MKTSLAKANNVFGKKKTREQVEHVSWDEYRQLNKKTDSNSFEYFIQIRANHSLLKEGSVCNVCEPRTVT